MSAMAVTSFLKRRQSKNGKRVAIYTRFSTKYQHSTDSQIRACIDAAENLGFIVDKSLIFSDEAVSGQRNQRPAFKKFKEALDAGLCDVVIIFATNRLHRKFYRALMFVNENLVERGFRAIFISQNIDTNDEAEYKQKLNFHALMDEYMSTAGVAHIKAAHIHKTFAGEAVGQRSFGYQYEAIPGRTNRSGQPMKRVVICVIESKYVGRIFHWFAVDRLTYQEIVLRLNNDPECPKPARSKQWSTRYLPNLMKNRRYIGDWSYGWTKNIWPSSNNGPAKQFLDKPQKEIALPALRIIEDDLFAAAQARLLAMPGAGGRPNTAGPSTIIKHPLACMLHCPVHGSMWCADGAFWCKTLLRA